MRIGVIGRGIATSGRTLTGGGDVFQIRLMKALKELGYHVVLSVVSPTRWDVVYRDLGWVCKPDVELKRFSPPMIDRAKLLRQFLPSLHIEMLKRTCDMTINAYGDNIFWNTSITYMHTPQTKEELKAKYDGNRLSRAYYRLYLSIANKMKRKLRTLILTNSLYSKKIIEETVKLTPTVLYPPIDTTLYRSAIGRTKDRKNYVITVARLTREKNLHLIPEIASRVKKGIFHILGSTILPESIEVVRNIRKRSSELGVGERVRIHMNLPTKNRLDIMALSKVYINTLKEEHFGMAIAEAMSAGLAPIVPDDGGQVEIVPDHQHLYSELEEASSKIDGWLAKWSPTEALHLSRMAEKFSCSEFQKGIRHALAQTKSRRLLKYYSNPRR